MKYHVKFGSSTSAFLKKISDNMEKKSSKSSSESIVKKKKHKEKEKFERKFKKIEEEKIDSELITDKEYQSLDDLVV